MTSITVEQGNRAYHVAGGCLIETASKTLIAGFGNCDIPSDGSVTMIGDYAFAYCERLTDVTVPASVKSIGYAAFYGCDSLTSITVLSPTTEICDMEYTISDTATIRGCEDSTASAYADAYDRAFDSIGVSYVIGDVNGDGQKNSNDAIYLLYNVIFGNASYPVSQPCDFNGDGTKNSNDAIYLLYHVIFGGTSYPLH